MRWRLEGWEVAILISNTLTLSGLRPQHQQDVAPAKSNPEQQYSAYLSNRWYLISADITDFPSQSAPLYLVFERWRWLHLFGFVQHNAYLLQKVNTTYYAHFIAAEKGRRFFSTHKLNFVGISLILFRFPFPKSEFFNFPISTVSNCTHHFNVQRNLHLVILKK